ncbi:RNA-binding KH domain-containing protein PEPPER [Striga hermonthica]|uniref:RNA-binding KH domain-containing protein PEPPER n=1 Tax=Striga hermonthica TaxID=68872 RepID=A0A9N7RA14_STRHE|nr:RNA-binding KH domain-containing protein PEPPER [Striga hermonthica]
MASPQPAVDNGVSTSDQFVAGDAAENSGEEAGAPSAAETKNSDEKQSKLAEIKAKWPGWPGYNVFRIVVPVLKVGGIIGRKGDIVKKLVEETRAKIRVLDGPLTSPDRIVLVTGKEEPEAPLSPAMDAIIRIFKRVNGLPENDCDGQTTATAGTSFCAIRLLVASTQAISLIGKQGSLIKSIQENTGASVRVHSNGINEMPIYASSDERIVEIQGEGYKVLKALEAVIGHLRKFLVDHSIIALFEKSYNSPAAGGGQVDTAKLPGTSQSSLTADYPVPVKRDLYLDRETHIESHIPPSRLSLYGSDHGLVGPSSVAIGRSGGPVVTQIAQTMQIPLAYAEDIIGVQGTNIDYIRRTSGAILTVEESRGLPEEITVEIKGTSSQVQAAQQLIQDFIGGHREPLPGSYSKLESSLRSSYAQFSSSSYPSSTFTGQQPYGGYGSSGVGGYSSSYNRL